MGRNLALKGHIGKSKTKQNRMGINPSTTWRLFKAHISLAPALILSYRLLGFILIPFLQAYSRDKRCPVRKLCALSHALLHAMCNAPSPVLPLAMSLVLSPALTPVSSSTLLLWSSPSQDPSSPPTHRRPSWAPRNQLSWPRSSSRVYPSVQHRRVLSACCPAPNHVSRSSSRSVSPSVCPSVRPSVRPSVCPRARPRAHPHVSPHACPNVHQSAPTPIPPAGSILARGASARSSDQPKAEYNHRKRTSKEVKGYGT